MDFHVNVRVQCSLGQVRVLLSTYFSRKDSSDIVIATRCDDDDSCGSLQRMLNDILRSLEGQDCATAMQLVSELGKVLKVAQGHASRPKGGYAYLPEFILDTVMFADCLKPLKTDVDMMQEALRKKLTLSQHIHFCVQLLLLASSLNFER